MRDFFHVESVDGYRPDTLEEGGQRRVARAER